MKKTKILLMMAVVLATGLTASAQDSKIMAGAGLDYASEIKNFGIHLNGLYLINDTWEADAGFTYYFKKDYTTWSALNFNAHYVFSADDKMSFYALAGLNMTFYKFKMENPLAGYNMGGDEYGGYDGEEYYSEYDPYAEFANALTADIEDSGSEVGINLGIGGRLALTEQLYLMGEIKYTIGGADYFNIGTGILYHF